MLSAVMLSDVMLSSAIMRNVMQSINLVCIIVLSDLVLNVLLY
jgi:hypothetical protein